MGSRTGAPEVRGECIATETADVQPCIITVPVTRCLSEHCVAFCSERAGLKMIWNGWACYSQSKSMATQGSLTTPPYTEEVRWQVMSEVLDVSAEQVERRIAWKFRGWRGGG